MIVIKSGEDLVRERKRLGLTQAGLYALVSNIFSDRTYISKIESGRRNLTQRNMVTFEEVLGRYEQEQFQIDHDDRLHTQVNEEHTVYGARPVIETGAGQYVITVPFISSPMAAAGYPDGFRKPGYLDALPRYPVLEIKKSPDHYLAVRVTDDSMADGTSRSICDGDIVIGTEIKQERWRQEFYGNQVSCYIIVHQNGLLIRQITSHDAEKGSITCHSLNQDKSKNTDQDILLNHCFQIWKVTRLIRAL